MKGPLYQAALPIVRNWGGRLAEHSERVGRNVWFISRSDVAAAAGLLHDAVEDGKMGMGEVATLIGDEGARLVGILTRRDGEEYLGAYIQRVKRDRVATLIKLMDIADNEPGAPGDLGQRYKAARKALNGRG